MSYHRLAANFLNPYLVHAVILFFSSVPLQQNTAQRTTNEIGDIAREVCGVLDEAWM